MGTDIVTGRASGIGAATKRELIFEGHRVIVVDNKDCDVIADLATMDGRKAAVAAVRKSAPEGVVGLVTCAALHPVEPNEKIKNVNYFGTLELVEGLRDLLSIRNGSVVLVASHTLVFVAKDDLVEILLSGDLYRILDKVGDMEGLHVYASIKK